MPTVKECMVRKPNAAEKDICKRWPIWTCGVSQFEWEYTQTETCLILEGRVTVSDLPDSGESMSFGPETMLSFLKALSVSGKWRSRLKNTMSLNEQHPQPAIRFTILSQGDK